MFFQVLTRTIIKMIAATIQVQIIEFVTGNPRTLKTAGAADGTFSSAGSAGCVAAVKFAGFEIVPSVELLVAVCEGGCAFKLAAKIATKNAQIKKNLLNGFTVKIASDDTNYSINQTNCGFENFKTASS
jgi:hypothetical protein